MMIMGWTLGQWAEVAAWHEHTFKMLPTADMCGAIEIRRQWIRMRSDNPGEWRIIEVAHEMNFAYASKMFERAFKQAQDSLRPVF